MSGHRNFREISGALRSEPERRARIEQGEQAIETGLTIAQLREARGQRQGDVATTLEVTQSNVSHFERSPNVYLRSLADYIAALGGRLELTAVFPDAEVRLAVPTTQIAMRRDTTDESVSRQAAGF